MKERITTIMTKERLTPTKFAEILKIQPSNISHLLSGRNKPSFELLLKIKEAFPHISGDWLISGSGSYRIIADNVPDSSLISSVSTSNKSLFDLEPPVANSPIDNALNGQISTSTDLPQSSKESPKEIIAQQTIGKLKKVLLIYDDNTFEEAIAREKSR